MTLKSAIKSAINQNAPKHRALKVWGIEKSSSLWDDERGEETWMIEVKVKKLKKAKSN